ncbi:MAG: acylphosphatase [Lentimicrobium sp.]|nr:acylphosphatase [Lentimicrobium sp.]
MKKCITIRVSGKVQGVGFRYYTADAANKTGISGYVKNETDGSVLIEAEGTPDQLTLFLQLCRQGPVRSVVSNLMYNDSPLMSYTSFRIR